MRELSFQEMNHVSGAGITFHAPSEQTVQLIAGASLAWFQTASVVTFLGCWCLHPRLPIDERSALCCWICCHTACLELYRFVIT